MNAPAHKRKFAPLWRVESTAGGHIKITDANGVELSFVYVRDERAGASTDGLSEDEARRIAVEHC